MPLYLYHYTNPKGASGIERDQMIRATPANSKFAWFGKGVYLTSLPPTAGWRAVLWNNHRKHDTKDKNLIAKTSIYYKFDASKLVSVKKMIVKDGRDIFLYPKHIDLGLVPYQTGFTNDICVEEMGDVEYSSESETDDEEYSSESETEEEEYNSEGEKEEEYNSEGETEEETTSESETEDESDYESETDDESDYDSEEEDDGINSDGQKVGFEVPAVEDANISETEYDFYNEDCYSNDDYHYGNVNYDCNSDDEDDNSDYYDD